MTLKGKESGRSLTDKPNGCASHEALLPFIPQTTRGAAAINRLDCQAYNRAFPKYPALMEDKGWIHGVWYCGGFCVSTIYGQYPWSFLKRALSLFPGIDSARVLHCPSGTLNGDTPGVTVDLVRDEIRKPQIIASADALPFPDSSFDLVLSDPPYSKDDAKKYGTPPYPLKKAMAEFRRVLAPGGYFGLLHFYYPTFQRKDWDMKALIGVCTGSNRKARFFTIFQNTKSVPRERQSTLTTE